MSQFHGARPCTDAASRFQFSLLFSVILPGGTLNPLLQVQIALKDEKPQVPHLQSAPIG